MRFAEEWHLVVQHYHSQTVCCQENRYYIAQNKFPKGSCKPNTKTQRGISLQKYFMLACAGGRTSLTECWALAFIGKDANTIPTFVPLTAPGPRLPNSKSSLLVTATTDSLVWTECFSIHTRKERGHFLWFSPFTLDPTTNTPHCSRGSPKPHKQLWGKELEDREVLFYRRSSTNNA